MRSDVVRWSQRVLRGQNGVICALSRVNISGWREGRGSEGHTQPLPLLTLELRRHWKVLENPPLKKDNSKSSQVSKNLHFHFSRNSRPPCGDEDSTDEHLGDEPWITSLPGRSLSNWVFVGWQVRTSNNYTPSVETKIMDDLRSKQLLKFTKTSKSVKSHDLFLSVN